MGISHVTVLGAGWCGLSVAWKLQEAGIQTLVLEAQPEVGGLAKTVHWEGFRFEVGPESFLTNEQVLVDAMRSLMGGQFQVGLRKHQIRFQDRWIPYPLNTRSLLTIPKERIFRATIEYIRLLMQNNFPVGNTFWSGKRRQPEYGEVLDQLLMSESFLEHWKSAPSSYRPSWSVESLQRKASLKTLQQLFTSVFQKPETDHPSFHLPSEGMSSIAARMRRRIEDLGGEVVTDIKLRRIHTPNNEVESVLFHGEEEQQVHTDYVFSTIPIAALLSRLDPLPSHRLIEEAFQLRHKGMFYLNILLDRPKPKQSWYYYFPENQDSFFRAGYAIPSVERRESSTSQSCLTVEWILEPDSPLYRADPEDFLQDCIPCLERAGLLVEKDISSFHLHRELHALPVYKDRSESHLRQVQAFLTSIRRLRSLGRQGSFDDSALSSVLRKGFRAASDIINERST